MMDALLASEENAEKKIVDLRRIAHDFNVKTLWSLLSPYMPFPPFLMVCFAIWRCLWYHSRNLFAPQNVRILAE